MKPAIVRISSDELGDRDGTAFFVSDEIAVTAFHLVGNSETGKLLVDEVSLNIPGGGTSPRTFVLDYDQGLDVAILRTSQPIESVASLGIWDRVSVGDDFRVTGFAQVQQLQFATLTGHVSSTSQQLDDGSPVIELVAVQLLGRGIDPHGLSGAPVMVHNRAIGVVRRGVESEDGNYNQDGTGRIIGGTFCATPMLAIIDRWRGWFSSLVQHTSGPENKEQLEQVVAVVSPKKRDRPLPAALESGYTNLWDAERISEPESHASLLRSASTSFQEVIDAPLESYLKAIAYAGRARASEMNGEIDLSRTYKLHAFEEEPRTARLLLHDFFSKELFPQCSQTERRYSIERKEIEGKNYRARQLAKLGAIGAAWAGAAILTRKPPPSAPFGVQASKVLQDKPDNARARDLAELDMNVQNWMDQESRDLAVRLLANAPE